MGDLPDFVSQVTVGSDTQLYSAALVAGGQSPLLDASAYQSLEITTDAQVSVGVQGILVTWFDARGFATVTDNLTSYASGAGEALPPMLVPVRGPQFIVRNQSPIGETVTVLGTNRPMAKMLGVGYTDVSHYSTGQIAMVAGTTYPLAPDPLAVQGLCWLSALFGGTTAVGELVAQSVDASGVLQSIRLGTSPEATTVGANRFLCRQVILPASLTSLAFICRTAGTANVSADFIAAGA